jgi:hypothetical protein
MEVVMKEQDVSLQTPVDLVRAADLVGEPELSRVLLSGRATPRTSFLAITIRVVLGEPVKIFFCLPFLPACKILAENKEVRCVTYG